MKALAQAPSPLVGEGRGGGAARRQGGPLRALALAALMALGTGGPFALGVLLLWQGLPR